MIVYGIHFSTAAYFWAKWVVQQMFMRFEQHTIFLTYPKTPFAQSEFSPLLWKMSLGHGWMHLNDKTTRQAGCYRNKCWIRFLNTGLLYDMQLQLNGFSSVVAQNSSTLDWYPLLGILFQYWDLNSSILKKTCTGNGDPLLRLRQSVGEDSPYYVTLVISHRGRRAFFICPEHCHQKIKFNLVGGFNPSEKYYCSQLGWLFPM